MSDTIGLIAAMSQESRGLLRIVEGWKRVKLGDLPTYTFTLSMNNVVLVTSGMGVRRAEAATHRLVAEYDPRLLISFGIAGAVQVDLDIGDVVVAESYCRLEQGAIGEATDLAVWPEAAKNAISQALAERGKCLYFGTAITTGGSQLTEAQVSGRQHPILEMETAGIAHVSLEMGIPLYSLRAISDGPRAPIPLDLTEVMDEDANLRPGKLIGALARRPGMIFQGMQMMRNSQRAADIAALALVAGLCHWAD
jgi:adenosylhomocysteine nucleosidase